MRIEQLTFTRFFAAVSIVIFHYGMNVFPFNTLFMKDMFKHANIGVSYFFILSGFVMIIAYGSKEFINSKEYFRNRIVRIYPAYLLSIVILLVYKFIIHSPVDFTGLILNIFAVQAWIPGKALSFNSPGWSLSVEFFFYIIFPFLFNKVYKTINYSKIVLFIPGIWLVSQIIFLLAAGSGLQGNLSIFKHDLLYYFPIMHLNQFLLGNLAGLFFMTRLFNIKRNFDIFIIALLIILLVLIKYPFGLDFHNGLLGIFFIPLILLISINNGWLTIISKFGLFIFLGEISYSIYVLQFPVFLYSTEFLQYIQISNPAFQFYISLFILLCISALSYHYFETPLRKKIKNIIISRPL